MEDNFSKATDRYPSPAQELENPVLEEITLTSCIWLLFRKTMSLSSDYWKYTCIRIEHTFLSYICIECPHCFVPNKSTKCFPRWPLLPLTLVTQGLRNLLQLLSFKKSFLKKCIYWLCYYSCLISSPSLHSILSTPSLPHSPPIVHVHGSYL